MNRAYVLRISSLLALAVALAATPKLSFAQHGGHGGGGFHGGGFSGHGGGFGGFHGGGFHGGGGGFHGGSFGGFHHGGFNGFHNRGFGGFHGGSGFNGFRGGRGFRGFYGNRFYGGFGYPWYGYGLSAGFGFWPYWDYPYSYGYSPWWYAPYPYYYPYSGYDPDDSYDGPNGRCRPDYRYPNSRCDDSDDSRPHRDYGPSRPTNTIPRDDYPDRNYTTSNYEDYRRLEPVVAAARTATKSGNYQFAYDMGRQLPSAARPAVRNAVQALRAMPPEARERQLNSHRYASFSPQERELLTQASYQQAKQ
jgi:hypothetical protein